MWSERWWREVLFLAIEMANGSDARWYCGLCSPFTPVMVDVINREILRSHGCVIGVPCKQLLHLLSVRKSELTHHN